MNILTKQLGRALFKFARLQSSTRFLHTQALVNRFASDWGSKKRELLKSVPGYSRNTATEDFTMAEGDVNIEEVLAPLRVLVKEQVSLNREHRQGYIFH